MIGLMKDELGETIMAEFVGLRPKICSYLIDDGNNVIKMRNKNKA